MFWCKCFKEKCFLSFIFIKITVLLLTSSKHNLKRGLGKNSIWLFTKMNPVMQCVNDFFGIGNNGYYEKRGHACVQQCFLKLCTKCQSKRVSRSGTDTRGTWQAMIFLYFALSSPIKFSWLSFNLGRSTCSFHFFFWIFGI